jgi:hypothetical protein
MQHVVNSGWLRVSAKTGVTVLGRGNECARTVNKQPQHTLVRSASTLWPTLDTANSESHT